MIDIGNYQIEKKKILKTYKPKYINQKNILWLQRINLTAFDI